MDIKIRDCTLSTKIMSYLESLNMSNLATITKVYWDIFDKRCFPFIAPFVDIFTYVDISHMSKKEQKHKKSQIYYFTIKFLRE